MKITKQGGYHVNAFGVLAQPPSLLSFRQKYIVEAVSFRVWQLVPQPEAKCCEY